MSRSPLVVAALLLLTLGSAVGLAADPAAVPTRDQIPDQYKWNLSTMYADLAAWEADFAQASRDVAALAAAQKQPLDSADVLLKLLDLQQNARWCVDKLVVYASQLSDQDTRDNGALGLKGRATALLVGYNQATAWIEPTLLALPAEKVKSWCDASAPLAVYRHYLDDIIRQRAHTLSPREEELLAMAGNLASAPEETFSVLANGELPWPKVRDADGQEITLSSARYDKMIRSTDRQVRKAAFAGAMSAYGSFRNTFAATLNGVVQRNIYFAKAHGFATPLESVLFPDNLPATVYTNLIETVDRHLPLLHQWASLRKKALGVDELHMYDLYTSLADGPQPDIKYDDAVKTILAALQPLGPEYCSVAEQGFHSRWIDVYETQGKRAGGYSWGSYDTQPYILINFNGTPREVSVIAHEMGHSMHSYFTHHNQPKVYGEYSGFVAEVASIFNELLLEEYQLQQAKTPAARFRQLNEMIDNLRGTVFRQVMFAEFEYGAHEIALRGDAITADQLGALYLDTFHKFWGPEVVRDAEHAAYWARVPHFYMNHYVSRYASSYCAAAALAEGVLAGKPGALDAYLGFLKSGCSDYPLEILRKAGVDLTTPAPIEATMRRFERLLNELKPMLDTP